MANARLKLARVQSRKRRRNDAEPLEPSSTEVPAQVPRPDDANCGQDEQESATLAVDADVRVALLDRKRDVETRLSALTVGKPLPRLEERGFDANGVRLKRTHRDFLLQEMEWMAADFAQERKWRMKMARTLSLSVQSHESKRASRSARQEKMEEEARRRVAARVGREVKKFWTKIDKIISFKVKLQSDELRKAAMDRHLKNLVAQTERYASALADAFCDPPEPSVEQQQDDTQSEEEHAPVSDKSDLGDRQKDSDSDFEAHDEEQDDETTIAAEEEQQQDASQAEQDDEITALQMDSEMSLDELRAKYALMASTKGQADKSDDGEEHKLGSSSGDSDFADEEDEEMDDETTMAADEQMTSRADVDDEVARLQEEGELSIEELRARYAVAALDGRGDDEDNEVLTEGRVANGGSDRESNDNDIDDGADEDDFRPSDVEEVDDESTLEIAERTEFTKDEVDEEVLLLQQESEMSIEELRAKYASIGADDEGVDEQRPSSERDDGVDDQDDSDFEQNGTDEEDDETTIAEAEHSDRWTKDDADTEIAKLEEEGNLSIEELRARYFGAQEYSSSEGEETDEFVDTTDKEEHHFENGEQNGGRPDDPSTDTEHDEPSEASNDEEVSTYRRPYLLTSRLELREYQEAGVNWLTSMCEKRINGILADEMGLGKTIQTITMLAHLACARGVWGPHLIVVPTSCMVNWEMEFKRWCPAFKVLTYFGSAKRRKELRHGWSKQNAFQVCITSYQLVVQDAHCFKRKKWYYLILDEAHNIKNWKSLRWQTLLHFNSQRRLLLTGTPLQNNIMELWSLMHFLMPHVFASRKEFTYWFQNPLSVMVEESTGKGAPGADPAASVDAMAAEQQQLVSQLHGIIRPFVLRRLKKDVAKQLPGKFEHVVTCSLSKRQRFLYEDFISRSSTRRALFGAGKRGGGGASGNFMSMMNVLMQLRKVCNHPDLFEPRPIESPLDMEALVVNVPAKCGFIYDWMESPTLAWWPAEMSLPNQELDGADKIKSQRARDLLHFYDDVSLTQGLPDECSLTKKQSSSRPDVLRRLLELAEARRTYWLEKRRSSCNSARVQTHLHEPMLGADFIRVCTMPVFISHAMEIHSRRGRCDVVSRSVALSEMVRDPERRIDEMQPTVRKAICVVPKARARPLQVQYGGSAFSADACDRFKLSRKARLDKYVHDDLKPVATRCVDTYYDSFKRTQLFFPDKRLIQFDCGKLQQLDLLLRELKRGNHRCLIFTQMSSMLNILEIFLNLHGYTYFRLDGSTKVEQRQYLMEKFNHDDKIFCFILSTRSGGLGINLTGADSVIFYDSDWNPAMDAQAQDRAHRIGQTRDVHIYRLVSEHTVEENILKKAEQKRHLDFLVMAKGEFTTEFFSKASLRELMGDLDDKGDEAMGEEEEEEERSRFEEVEEDEDDMSLDAIENAMAQLEDEDDVVAMRGAREEFLTEQREFEEEIGGATIVAGGEKRRVSNAGTEISRASTPTNDIGGNCEEEKEGENDDDKDTVATLLESSATASVVDDEETRDDASQQNVLDDSRGATDVQSVEEDASMLDDDEEEADTAEGSEAEDEEEEEEEVGSGSDEDSDDDMSDDYEERTQPQKKAAGSGAGPKRSRASGSNDSVAAAKRQKTEEATALANAAQMRKKLERAKEKAREQEDERKLQAWKDSVSSLQNFEDSLNSVDRYALHFREDVDPLFAYVPTAEAYGRLEDEANLKLNIEEIEARKMVEEQQWIADGELIAGVAGIEELSPSDIEMHYQLYKKERANVHAARRQRQLTGLAWELKKCAITGQPFYYNSDTREATWEKPSVWVKNEQCATARELGFAGLPSSVLLLIFGKLCAYPDRLNGIQFVCRAWRDVALHPSLSIRVNASDFFHLHGDLSRRDHWKELLEGLDRGETLLFGSGVYEIHDAVEIKKPIRLLAAHDAHVELQMATPRAQLKWTARGGLICGFHVSRRHSASLHTGEPTNNWQHLLHVAKGGSVRAVFNDFDGNHQGNACLAVSGDPLTLLVLQHNRIFHSGSGSGVMVSQGALVMQRNSVYQNAHSGITVWSGNAVLRRNQIFSNKRFGIRLLYHANNVVIEENKVENHPCGNIDVENSGRRFVVRWNEMLKDQVDDLPHHHGQLKLLTSRVEERIIKMDKPVTMVKTQKPATPLVASFRSTSGASVVVLSKVLAVAFAPPLASGPPRVWPQLATSLAPAAAAAAVAKPLALAVSTVAVDAKPPVPVPVAVSTTVGVNSAAAAAVAAPSPAETKPMAVVSVPTSSPAAPSTPNVEVPSSTTLPVETSSVKVEQSVGPAATPTPTPAPTSASTIQSVPVPAPALSSAALPSTTTSNAAPASSASVTSAAAVPVKAKRKRKTKTEKVLVHGVEILFKDTCEKKGDKKAKKPRRASSDGSKVAKPAKVKTEAVGTTHSVAVPVAAHVDAVAPTEPLLTSFSGGRPHLPEATLVVEGESTNEPSVEAVEGLIVATDT